MADIKPYIAGIDPGLDGAIAFIGNDQVTIHDMPTFEVTTNGKKRRQVDLYGLAAIFELFGHDTRLITIEEPSAMPKDGVIQAFKFGFNCGVVQSMAASHMLPMKLVRPNAWKASMGLTGDKDMSRKRASEICPKFAHLWPLKKHDGRAESVLLAMYGARMQ